MQIQFAPTENSFRNFLKLYRTTNAAARFRHFLFMWGAPAVAIWSLLNDVATYIVLPRFQHLIITRSGVISDVLILVVCVFCFLSELNYERSAYRKYLSIVSPSLLDGQFHLSISDDGIEVLHNDKDARKKYPWEYYGSSIQDKSTIILFSSSKKTFQYFPLDAFSADELSDFTAFLTEKLGKG